MKLPTLDAVWLVLPFAGVVIAASVEPLPPYDFWWHLVMGRLLAAGVFPESNLFLYTMAADTPFHDQPWLAQWLMYRVHEAGGLVGGMALRTCLLCLSWAVLVVSAVRRSTPRIGGFLALAAVVVSYPVLTYRTRLFAFLPFVVLIATLLDERRSRWAPLWLFAATVWWANVHGTFVLAPALTFGAAGAAAIEALSRRELREWLRVDSKWWAAVGAATSAGTLLTPHGLDNLGYVVTLAVTSNVSATVSEWLPPDLTTGVGAAWAIAFVAALALLAACRREVRVVEVALLLATTYLAASAIRSVFWWAATAALVCAPHAAALAVRFSGRHTDSVSEQDSNASDRSVINLALIGALVAAALGLHPGIAPTDVRLALGGGRMLSDGAGAGILSSENAVVEVELALERAGRGRVFHDQALGGLIEWESGSEPAPVAFVDQRMELIPESTWEVFFETSSGAGWREVFAKHDVRAVVLAVEGQWPLIQALDEAPDWKLVRVGPLHWVFAKID